MAAIQPIVMPKWGLAMEEGTLTRWTVDEGQPIAKGQEIADIETTKIANVFESPVGGVLRRRVAPEGETLPVGALIGVVADKSVPDAEVDAFVETFNAEFATEAKSGAKGPEPRSIEAGGRRLRVLSIGEDGGTPVLLIHGFGSDLMSWLFNQEALAGDRAVHAVDLPGHGGSDKAVSEGSVPALADAIRDAMDALGLARAHLVGHSLGGAIAARIALDTPERVASATLLAPAGIAPEIAQEFIDGFISESRARKLRGVLEMLVADPNLITADMTEDVLRFKRLDGAESALRTIASANFQGGKQAHQLAGELGAAKPPIQVIVGENDRILPSGHAASLPPAVKVIRLQGAGHLPHMEKSGEVNEAIRAFIKGVD
jgi:pyruvate dehydrogenase E2 component (dihydrolipoamide acetyltransferase)